MLLNVEEKNSVYMMENYDIEIYESGSEGWNKLDFVKRQDNIVDGFLVNQPSSRPPNLNSSFVEYYFDVFVDDEVDEVIICKSLDNLKSKGIYIETEFNCPDIPSTISPLNPYSTLDIESPSDECATDLPGGSS